MNVIYTWGTTKTEAGFEFKVYEMTTRETPNANGHYADTKLLQSGVRHSRDAAKRIAQKWVRYLKHKAN